MCNGREPDWQKLYDMLDEDEEYWEEEKECLGYYVDLDESDDGENQ